MAGETERVVLVARGEETWDLLVDESGEARIFIGSKQRVIEDAYNSLGGDEGLKPGDQLAFRAPSLRSWKGERVMRVPDEPKPERLWRE